MSENQPRRFPGAILGAALGAFFGYILLSYRMRIWLRGTEHAADFESLSALVGAFVGMSLGVVLAPFARQFTQSRLVTPYGVVMTILIVFIWLVPMALTGILNTSLLDVPAAIRNQYRISCLFTHSSKTWQTVHYEVRLEGQLSWKEGPLEGFFDVDIFGHRTRFNRIMLASKNNDPKSRLRRKEVAQYIVNRWPVVFPDTPTVKEIRITQVSNPVGGKHCMAREPWSRPVLANVPKRQKRVIADFSMAELK